jgi:plasmid maintenance system killer protein
MSRENRQSQSAIIKRYYHVINKLRDSKNGCTLKELIKNLENNDDFISGETLKRDVLSNLKHDGVVKLEKKNKYVLVNEEFRNAELVEFYLEMGKRAIIFDTLKEAKDSLNLIHVEASGLFEGIENLGILFHAVKNSQTITFEYQSFKDKIKVKRTVQPYLLKEFEHRWYLVGYDTDKKGVRVFGLDRMKDSIVIGKFEKSEDVGIEIKLYLEKIIGVDTRSLTEEKQAQKVRLQFIEGQFEYIKTRKWHHSQQVEDEKQRIISLEVITNYELLMKIAALGNRVKILSPASLIEELKFHLTTTLANYSS